MIFKLLKNIFSVPSDEQLKNIIHSGAMLIDVRTPEEFAYNQVKGSINIPLTTLEQNINTLDKNKALMVFCASGTRSGYAKTLLEKNGFSNVHNGKSVSKINRILKTF